MPPGFSLVAASRGSCLVAHKLLTAVASLVAEHRLQGARASVVAAGGFESSGSVAVAHRCRCPEACGVFPKAGIKLLSSASAGGFFTSEPPGKPQVRSVVYVSPVSPALFFERTVLSPLNAVGSLADSHVDRVR